MMCENVELEIFEKDQTEILVDLSLNDAFFLLKYGNNQV